MRKVEHFNVDYGHLLLWMFDVSGRAVAEQSGVTAEPCRRGDGFSEAEGVAAQNLFGN